MLFYDKIIFSEAIDRQKQWITWVQYMSLKIFFWAWVLGCSQKDEIPLQRKTKKVAELIFQKIQRKIVKRLIKTTKNGLIWSNLLAYFFVSENIKMPFMFKNLTVLEDEKTVKCNDLLERN